jgi:hypothetical protein
MSVPSLANYGQRHRNCSGYALRNLMPLTSWPCGITPRAFLVDASARGYSLGPTERCSCGRVIVLGDSSRKISWSGIDENECEAALLGPQA